MLGCVGLRPPADRRADVQDRIARLDRKIEQVKYVITCWQDELEDLEAERAESFDGLDELEAQEIASEEE
jgi:septal ring factor EnvC (AmiA/AmiB activator)